MPDSFARLLRRLQDEGHVARSQFSSRSFRYLRSLFDVGALEQARRGGGMIVAVKNPAALEAFYHDRYPGAGATINLPPRAATTGALRNAKRARRTHMEPVLLRAFHPIVCTRHGQSADLQSATNLTGAACLILEAGQFWTMSASLALVENLECFLHFEQMGVAADVALYASGRLSGLALSWLRSPELAGCRFIHCGDYDPVGLDEYLRLKTAVGDRARLHVPPQLQELVAKYGRPELLGDSQAVLRRLRDTSDPVVSRVVRILDATGLGLEQEALLLSGFLLC